MTQDEIIELAGHRKVPQWVIKLVGDAVAKERKEFAEHAVEIARRAVEAEGEACAKICDKWAVGWPHPSTVIADEIRARGNK
jgi:hypothetical protein